MRLVLNWHPELTSTECMEGSHLYREAAHEELKNKGCKLCLVNTTPKKCI